MSRRFRCVAGAGVGAARLQAQALGELARDRLHRDRQLADRLLHHLVQKRPDEGFDLAENRPEAKLGDPLDRLLRDRLNAFADLLDQFAEKVLKRWFERRCRRIALGERSISRSMNSSSREPNSAAMASTIDSDSRIRSEKCCATMRSASSAEWPDAR